MSKVARNSRGNLAANEMLNKSVVSNSVKPSGITVCCWEIVLPYYILQAVICNEILSLISRMFLHERFAALEPSLGSWIWSHHNGNPGKYQVLFRSHRVR